MTKIKQHKLSIITCVGGPCLPSLRPLHFLACRLLVHLVVTKTAAGTFSTSGAGALASSSSTGATRPRGRTSAQTRELALDRWNTNRGADADWP